MSTCALCSAFQMAVVTERSTVERLYLWSVDNGARCEDMSEDAFAELSCRRDDYERARSKRLRADNRFFDDCPRCHFDFKAARRDLDERRGELPWHRHESAPASSSVPLARGA